MPQALQTSPPQANPSPISPSVPLHAPELLSPAGNWECARAAVANGADAIYFGMPRFNARMRADNFTAADLPELMKFLHSHGVKGYCAFNTLIFTQELADAEAQLRELEAAGVDAVIVQDIGLARLVKEKTPRLRLHASTQMTITSPESLRFAQRLGLDLAVLSRELSLRELARFQKDGNTLPLEVFVHGALCVAYSGQCLTSESLGQRSANRGECAQACRMPYELIVDGIKQELGEKRYLLSPQDLAAVDEIPRLIELGVHSFKIEGRLKTPEYVAAVTRVYRKAMDGALALLLEATNNPEAPTSKPPAPASHSDRYSLEMTFSRGLFSGWMHGVNHQALVGARFGKKRGAFIGEVVETQRDRVRLGFTGVPVKAGDGVVFENPAATDHEQGGYIFSIQGPWIEFQRGKLDLQSVAPGTRVYKTSDPALDRELRSTFQGTIPVRKRHALKFTVSGSVGTALHIIATTTDGKISVSADSDMLLQHALKRPLSIESLQEQLGKLGGTLYTLSAVDSQLTGDLILPVSELNRLRREIVEGLDAAIASQAATEAFNKPSLLTRTEALSISDSPVPYTLSGAAPQVFTEPVLHVLCRSMEHIHAALAAGVPRIYVDFEDVRRYAEAVSTVKTNSQSTEIFLATPRIQKAGEEGFFRLIERALPDGVLIRSLGAIEHFHSTPLRMTGDFSLNVANPLSAEFFIHAGLEQVTVSYDLNIEQALDLLHAAPPQWFELTLHQHIPMFHMEHCVFAAFMSEGTSFLNCGRPCEKHDVKLRDRVGMEHPLKADVGCRNTLFNAVPQTGARYFADFMHAGLRHYRLELLEESRPAAARTISLYQDLLTERRTGDEMWRDLKARSQLGVVTSGTLREEL